MPQTMSEANKIKAMREEFTSFDTDAGPAAAGAAGMRYATRSVHSGGMEATLVTRVVPSSRVARTERPSMVSGVAFETPLPAQASPEESARRSGTTCRPANEAFRVGGTSSSVGFSPATKSRKRLLPGRSSTGVGNRPRS